jgi:hypothetical protein
LSSPAFSIIPWGPKLFAYSNVATSEEAKRILVLDVGSGSIKAITYDYADDSFTEVKGGKFKKECGLGTGMVPNDPDPKLNAGGLEKYYNDALPACRRIIDKVKPDNILVLCTEAVRAAQSNPSQKHIVDEFILNSAKILSIDPKAINILSPELEAELAAEGVLYGHENADGACDTMGGNSRERSILKNGKTVPGKTITDKIGRNSLAALDPNDVAMTIEATYKATPWFDTKSLRKSKTVYFHGGTFREESRILAQRIYGIPFRAKMPFRGHAFANTQSFITHLEGLKSATKDSLLDECQRFEYRQRCRKQFDEKRYQAWKTKWLASKRYASWLKNWEDKIGARASFLRVAAEITLADIRHVMPRTVVFGVHSIREGALKHAGLDS